MSVDSKTLAVGTPVTRHPPHRPGRAVFPHPVPRLYSPSRKAISVKKIPAVVSLISEAEVLQDSAFQWL
jgi:hypothetical protein